jgi:hypothetical protein
MRHQIARVEMPGVPAVAAALARAVAPGAGHSFNYSVQDQDRRDPRNDTRYNQNRADVEFGVRNQFKENYTGHDPARECQNEPDYFFSPLSENGGDKPADSGADNSREETCDYITHLK